MPKIKKALRSLEKHQEAIDMFFPRRETLSIARQTGLEIGQFQKYFKSDSCKQHLHPAAMMKQVKSTAYTVEAKAKKWHKRTA